MRLYLKNKPDWWFMPVIPATQEAYIGSWSRPTWGKLRAYLKNN
jgi:hypothetical protein